MFGFVTSLVCWMVVISFTAAGGVQLVRLLPWVDRQMLALKKPWVCNLCMSWWTTLISTVFWVLFEHAPPSAAIPAFALSLVLVNHLGAPQSKPDFSLSDIPEMLEEKPE